MNARRPLISLQVFSSLIWTWVILLWWIWGLLSKNCEKHQKRGILQNEILEYWILFRCVIRSFKDSSFQVPDSLVCVASVNLDKMLSLFSMEDPIQVWNKILERFQIPWSALCQGILVGLALWNYYPKEWWICIPLVWVASCIQGRSSHPKVQWTARSNGFVSPWSALRRVSRVSLEFLMFNELLGVMDLYPPGLRCVGESWSY